MKQFNINLSCDYPQWWRYNVYISMVCCDENSVAIDYLNLVDKVYDLCSGAEERSKPIGYDDLRTISVTSVPCDHIILYIYVIANTLPKSVIVRDSPEFEVELTISCDGRQIRNQRCKVNQIGGLTIAAEEIK